MEDKVDHNLEEDQTDSLHKGGTEPALPGLILNEDLSFLRMKQRDSLDIVTNLWLQYNHILQLKLLSWIFIQIPVSPAHQMFILNFLKLKYFFLISQIFSFLGGGAGRARTTAESWIIALIMFTVIFRHFSSGASWQPIEKPDKSSTTCYTQHWISQDIK